MSTGNPICRKLNTLGSLSEEDQHALGALLSVRQSALAGATLIPDGHVGPEGYGLISGWACRMRMFEDGRRQISRLFLPGDFIGLNASLLGVCEQSIAALTDVQLAKFEGAQFANLLQSSPRLWLAFHWSDTRDRFIMEERVASIGRRSAYERLAHIFVELYHRLEIVGEATDDAFAFPLTQEHLADLLGLTSIHVNRVLRRLKEDGLISVDARTIRLLSPDKLMRVAEFDSRYLMHKR